MRKSSCFFCILGRFTFSAIYSIRLAFYFAYISFVLNGLPWSLPTNGLMIYGNLFTFIRVWGVCYDWNHAIEFDLHAFAFPGFFWRGGSASLRRSFGLRERSCVEFWTGKQPRVTSSQAVSCASPEIPCYWPPCVIVRKQASSSLCTISRPKAPRPSPVERRGGCDMKCGVWRGVTGGPWRGLR